MSVYESLVRPALFTLLLDLTHTIGHMALRRTLPWRMLAAAAAFDVHDPVLKTSFAGIDLASPVGLAAGFDTASLSPRCPFSGSASSRSAPSCRSPVRGI